MNNQGSDQDRLARALAGLALHLSAGRSQGRAPDLLEIEQFRRGDLPEPRRAEVLAHLAQDPQAFALLCQLEQAELELGRLGWERGGRSWSMRWIRHWWERLRSVGGTMSGDWAWRWPGGALVAVVLGMALLVVIQPWPSGPEPFDQIDELYGQLASVQAPSPGNWPWAHRPVDPAAKHMVPTFDGRSTQGSTEHDGRVFARPRAVHSLEEQALRAGVRQALERLVGQDSGWAATLGTLPDAAPDCPAAEEGCGARIAAAAAIGRWITLIDWHCRFDPRSDEAFWQQQDRLRLSLAAAVGATAPMIASELRDWPGETVRARLCRGAEVRLNGFL